MRDDTPARSLGLRSLAVVLPGLAMVGAYLFIGTYLKGIPVVEESLEAVSGSGTFPGLILLWLVLFASLVLPFSSAALFILLGLDLFGAGAVFATAFTAGLAATATTYAIGRGLGDLVRRSSFHERVEEARRYLEPRTAMVGLLTFLIKSAPNPLYDAWGYACGILRIPFPVYFGAAVAGGVIPLSLLCFGLERLL